MQDGTLLLLDAKMLELHITDNDVTGGNVAVSWCTDKELLTELANEQIKDPYLVIVVAPADGRYANKKEFRKVVPLSDLMTYVEFRAPGKNKVWAFVSQLSGKEARNEYLKRSDGEFATDILAHDGESFTSRFQEFTAEPLDLYVPEACFAPEPADWEKSWVNHFFNNPAVDQCHFRKRRIFAYTIQLVLMLGTVLARLPIYLLALLIGSRNLTMKCLFHPMEYSLKDSLDLLKGGSYFVRPDKGYAAGTIKEDAKYLLKRGWTVPLMPIILLPVLWLIFSGKAFILGIAGVVGVALLLILIGIWFFAEGEAKKLYYRIDAWLDDRLGPKEYAYLDAEEMDLLVCNGKPKGYNNLPSKKKTFKLRFHNLKAKVCRPFSA
jgi:hypothetical protein